MDAASVFAMTRSDGRCGSLNEFTVWWAEDRGKSADVPRPRRSPGFFAWIPGNLSLPVDTEALPVDCSGPEGKQEAPLLQPGNPTAASSKLLLSAWTARPLRT